MMNQLMGDMSPFNALTPFGHGPFMSPLNQFQNMMQQQSFGMPNSNGSSFVSSSFVSFSSDGSNPPRVYQETKMNQIGPNGVREERHSVQDSHTGLQKMKIGRHIQDRGHVIEKSKNRYTGDEEENNEFINIEEEEADQFQNEWSSRMNAHYRANGQQYLQGPRGQPRLAITAGPSSRNDSSPFNYCPAPTSSHNSSNESKKYKIKPILKNKKPSNSKRASKKE